MSQVILFSDLHAHPHKKKVERLEDCLKCLEWVFQTAADRNIHNILFGGDLFHDRKQIEIYTYYRTFEVLEKWMNTEKFSLWLLLGNHDLWYSEKTSISSVTPLSALPGVNVIRHPHRTSIEGHNWDFIPFTHNPVETVQQLQDCDGEPEYALGHIAIDGAMLHKSHISDVMVEHDGDMVKVDAGLFAEYKHVFLGHYHAEQRVIESVEYIGSPLELSFGEAFQDKHIIVLNQEDGQKEYVQNNFSPRHYIISQNQMDQYNLENNFVKLMVDDISSSDIVEMKNELLKSNRPNTLEIKQKKQRKKDENIIQDARSILMKEETLTAWLEQMGTDGMDKDKLLAIGQKICQSNN